MRSHRGALIMTYAIGAYAAGMVVVAVLVSTMGDRHPIGMLLLFGPRWMLAAPWLVLMIAFSLTEGVLIEESASSPPGSPGKINFHRGAGQK